MSAIFVLVGGEKQGPFTQQEVSDFLSEGRYSVDSLAWHEGLEDWEPLGQLLGAGSTGTSEDEPEAEVLAEGNGYVITTEDMIIGGEIFSLTGVLKATVEVEHVKRGGPIFRAIIFGLLAAISLAIPSHLQDPAHWVIWAVLLLIFVFVCIRNLVTVFQAGGTLLAVHLTNGDDRILQLPEKEAQSVAALVNQLAEEAAKGP
ncbi:MAG: hypothetical protein Fur0032_21270 [Terrimicrobiaceae bacterium]